MIKFITLLILNTNAQDALRIDQGVLEKFKPFSKKVEVIVSDNCAHCITQIKILKKCLPESDIVVLLDNKTKLNETRLRAVLRKKKITYPTYELNPSLKEIYNYKGITPMIHIQKKNGYESYTGVVQCDYLKV